MFDIKENLKKLPDSPGVYIHKDKLGQVIYVGKAVSLRTGCGSIFRARRIRIRKYGRWFLILRNLSILPARQRLEALILECNLIKNMRRNIIFCCGTIRLIRILR